MKMGKKSLSLGHRGWSVYRDRKKNAVWKKLKPRELRVLKPVTLFDTSTTRFKAGLAKSLNFKPEDF